MKKVFLTSSILLFVLFTLTGCGKTKTLVNKEFLTDERITILEDNIFLKSESLNYKTLKYIYTDDIIEAANARISAGSQDVSGIQKFSRFEFRSSNKADDYNYEVYGNLYGVDNFGIQKFKLISVSFHCEKTEETECDVKYDGFSLGDL